MPKINLHLLYQTLPPEDYALVRRITNPQTWVLRSARPKVHAEDPQSNLAAYVWRMTAFYISENPDHHKMPMGAFFYLPRDADKELLQRLDRIVDKITDTVPKAEWYAVKAWRGLYGASNDDMKLEARRRLGKQPKLSIEEILKPEPEPEEEEEEPFTDEWLEQQQRHIMSRVPII